MAKKKSAVIPSADMSTKAGELLDEAIKYLMPKSIYISNLAQKLTDFPVGKTILVQDREMQAALVSAALDRLEEYEKKVTAFGPSSHVSLDWLQIWMPRWTLMLTLRDLLRRSLPLSEETVNRLLQWPLQASNDISQYTYPLSGMAAAAENIAEDKEISDGFRATLEAFIDILRKNSEDKECRKIANRLDSLITSGPTIRLEAGEAWSDVALADLNKMDTAANSKRSRVEGDKRTVRLEISSATLPSVSWVCSSAA